MAALPSVGADFGDYLVTGVVGRGGMGVVYEATQRRLSRTVALKVLSSDFMDVPAYRDRFVREAETLSRLDSPHIIQIYDYGETDGCLFLATQLVRGGDLGQWLCRRGPLEVGLALDVIDQVACALADAHAAGVIHRDLKPENVLLRDGPHPFAYLGDFGIARPDDGPSTTSGTVVGTWEYLSPEQCNGSQTTARSDIYSLGCLLWTVLDGEAPYRGTELQVAMQHVNDPVPQLSLDGEVGHRINLILQRSMAKRPADRYERVEQLIADLREAAEVERSAHSQPAPQHSAARRPAEATVLRGASAAPRVSAAAPAVQPQRRRWLGPLATLVGVLVLAGVAGVAAYLVLNDSPSDGDSDPARRQAVLTRVSYDGDRLSDVAVQPNETAGDLAVFHSEGQGFAPPALTRQSGGILHRLNGDFDGDHRTDEAIFRPSGDGQSISVRLSQPGAGFGQPAIWGEVAGMGEDDGYPVSGDFDGNGRGDIAWVHVLSPDEMEVLVKLSTARGFGKAQLWEPAQQWSKKEMPGLNPGDVNADGRTDLVALPGDGRGGVSAQVLLSETDHFTTPQPWRTVENMDATSIKQVVGDFDGDSVADVLIFEAVDSSETPGVRGVLLESTKTGFRRPVVRFSSDSWVLSKSWVSPGDFDGDGLCDFARIAPSEVRGIDVWVALSTPGGFQSPRVWGSWGSMSFDDVRTLNRIG